MIYISEEIKRFNNIKKLSALIFKGILTLDSRERFNLKDLN